MSNESLFYFSIDNPMPSTNMYLDVLNNYMYLIGEHFNICGIKIITNDVPGGGVVLL